MAERTAQGQQGGEQQGEGQQGGGQGGEELWILKTAQHLGKGLQLLTAAQLAQEAPTRWGRGRGQGGTGRGARLRQA